MPTPSNARACVTCLLVSRVQRGKRYDVICGKFGLNAHSERADTNAWGPDGKFWTSKVAKPDQ